MKKLILVSLSLLFIPLMVGASIDTNLYYGLQNNSDVRELQELLIDKGFLTGTATGNFYSLTLKAVKAYQASEGIIQTGYVGTLTRTVINNDLSAQTSGSNELAVAETGATPPAPTQQATTNDVIATLQAQIALLLQQVQAMQVQQTATQQIVQNTQQIVQNTTPIVCTPNWQCGTWDACTSSLQTRTCVDANSCGVLTNKPSVAQSCAIACTPNWQMGSWNTCTNSQQTRTVTDSNSCGIATGQPTTIQSCDSSSVLNDGFDAYTNGSVVGQGGWGDRKNGSNFNVQSIATFDGTKALYINALDDSVVAKNGIPLSDGEQVVYIRTENRDSWEEGHYGAAQIRVSKGSWDGVNFIGVVFRENGNVAFYNGSEYTNFATYNDNEWTPLEIEWRSSDKTARYKVNNGTWTDWTSFGGSATFTNFDNLGFDFDNRNGIGGGVYFDNIH